MRSKTLPSLFIGNKAVTRIRLVHIEFIYILIRNLLNYLKKIPYFSLNRKYLFLLLKVTLDASIFLVEMFMLSRKLFSSLLMFCFGNFKEKI